MEQRSSLLTQASAALSVRVHVHQLLEHSLLAWVETLGLGQTPQPELAFALCREEFSQGQCLLGKGGEAGLHGPAMQTQLGMSHQPELGEASEEGPGRETIPGGPGVRRFV